MAFTDTYDTATPDGDADSPSEADDRMREIKAAVQERENVDHYWPKTGTEVSDADTGEHRKITLRTLSAAAVAALTAAKAYLYRLVTDGEFYLKDASDNTIQLTSGGKILSASLDMKDEDNMVSDSDKHAFTQQSGKAYVDALAAAVAATIAAAIASEVTLSAYTNQDSESNAMLKSHAYKAATGGQVTAYSDVPAGSGREIKGFVGTTNNPAGAGTLIQREENDGVSYSNRKSVSFLVAEGEYFEITVYSGTPVILWKSFGTLSEPIDQEP